MNRIHTLLSEFYITQTCFVRAIVYTLACNINYYIFMKDNNLKITILIIKFFQPLIIAIILLKILKHFPSLYRVQVIGKF